VKSDLEGRGSRLAVGYEVRGEHDNGALFVGGGRHDGMRRSTMYAGEYV